jgi:hypothetical protein
MTTGRIIEDIDKGIPDWCPLENADEEVGDG